MQPADRSTIVHSSHMSPGPMWAFALAAVAVAVQLCLVWGFDYFPSVDGPAHVHLAHILHESMQGDAFYGSLIELNTKLSPNMATQGVMVALMSLAPPFVAEKLWLTLYFASFAAAAAYALSAMNRNALCLLPFVMFCSISFPLAFGFYNFAFSSVIFLAWFGFWWRHRARLGWGIVAGHALFAVIAYATHIFAFVVTLLGIGLASLAAVLSGMNSDLRSSGPDFRRWRNLIATHMLSPLLGSIPVLLACLHFLLVRFGSHTRTGAANLAAEPGRFHELATAASLAPYDSAETIASTVFVLALCLLLLLLAVPAGRKKGSLPLAVCFAGFLVLYLILPYQWIVRWMPARFQPLVFITLLLWLAALVPASFSSVHWKATGATGLALMLLALPTRLEVFSRLNGYYREYASAAPFIAEQSTLIGLRLHDRLDGAPFPAKVDVLIQAGSRIATLRNSVDLKNFQGQSRDHPVQFRPGIGASAALGGDRAITAAPPRVDLMAYERLTGRPIDYVLFYGYRDAVADQDALARIDAQLQEDYRLIYASQPDGFVHLYARHAGDDPAPDP